MFFWSTQLSICGWYQTAVPVLRANARGQPVSALVPAGGVTAAASAAGLAAGWGAGFAVDWGAGWAAGCGAGLAVDWGAGLAVEGAGWA